MNSRILFLAFVGLALLILLIGALKFANLFKRFSRHEMTESMKKAIKFSFGTFIFALIVGTMFTFVYWYSIKQTASAVISLNYDAASEAKNANGTRYSMNDIVSKEVLNRAIEKGALENVTASELKSCTSVEQTVQGKSEEKEGYHISTEFRVTFTTDEYTEHLDPVTVVTLIAESYKDLYVSNYTENDTLLDMKIDPQTEFAGLEYLDVVSRLSSKAYIITDYLDGISAQNSGFVRDNGESAQSIRDEVLQYAEKKINDSLYSYILDNSVAKNRTIYKKRLNYQNTNLDYDLQKAQASFDTRNEAVKMYEESLMSIVLVPSWDELGEYYMSRTKLGLDELSLEAKDYSGSVAELKDSIESNKMIISKLTGATKPGAGDHVDHMIEEICDDLEEYAARARSLVRDFTENKLNRCVSINVQGWSFTKLLMACVIVTFLWNLALYVFMLSNSVENYVPSDDDRL